MIYVLTGFLVGVAVGLAAGLLLWRGECGRIESVRQQEQRRELEQLWKR